MFSQVEEARLNRKRNGTTESHNSKDPAGQEEIRHKGVRPGDIRWEELHPLTQSATKIQMAKVGSLQYTSVGAIGSHQCNALGVWVLCSLNLSDIELKDAQRFFAQKFSCGASVTAEDEIIIQGDFTDDIIDVIQEKWPEVSGALTVLSVVREMHRIQVICSFFGGVFKLFLSFNKQQLMS